MLSELIPQFFEHKQELDKYKKICKGENTEIKREMERQKITECNVCGLTAKYIVKKRETFDEGKLIALLKSKGYENLIKTKEYVDMDELESVLYHSAIDTETIMEMDKCKNVIETIELRVTKKKEAKNE